MLMHEWILDFGLKGLILLICAGGLSFGLGRSPASGRHGLWSLSIGALLVLPLVSLIPSVSLEVLPGHSRGTMPSAASASDHPVAPAVAGPRRRGADSTTLRKSARSVPERSLVSPGTLRPEPSPPWWPRVINGVWVSGAGVLLLRLLFERTRLRSLYRESFQVADPSWRRNLEWFESRLGIRRPVRVLMTAALPVPITWGLWRPVILFPIDALDWPEARIRSALLHEGAHLRRWDYAMTLVAHLARSIHWFNPFVWHAVRKLAIESELACDDQVVRIHSVPATDYAEHLIDVCYAMRNFGPCPTSASPMASRTSLRTRVESLLDERRPRRTARRTLWTMGIAGLLVLAPLTAVRIVERRQAHASNPGGAPTARVSPKTPTQRPATVEGAIEDCSRGDAAARKKAVWILGEREDRRAVPILTETLADADPEVRALAAWALGEIKDRSTRSTLEEALSDPDRYVREMVVRALGELEDGRATPALIAMLEDSSPDVCSAAVWALGEIGGPESLMAVTTVFPRHRDPVRTQAARVLGRKPCRAAMAPLITALKNDPSPEVRRAIADSLAAFGASRVSAALVDALRDRDAGVRRSAARSLGLLGDPETVEALLECLRDDDAEVRAMAVWSLDEIGQ